MDTFNIIIAFLSFLAYRFSKERFRLELFEKRFEVYKNVLEFCSGALRGDLSHTMITDSNKEQIYATILAAEGSFRGVGLHKAYALFGEDIHDLLKKLNESYAWLVTYNTRPDDATKKEEWAKTREKNFLFILETTKQLPDNFKSYVYFGNHKKQPWYKFWY